MEIVEVRSPAQWRDFHHLLHRVYRNDPSWIAPLFLERKFHFIPKHNPYFQHAEAEFFLAYKDGKPVGRITAQIDQLHLARYHDATGHFGFLEALDDAEVFSALIKKAEGWLSARGMKRVLGPVSFSMWDQPGLLVEGFDTPPYVLMGHALPYFAKHIEAAGYHKAEDLLAYRYGYRDGKEIPIPDVMKRILEQETKRGDLIVRNIRMDKRSIDGEIALLLDIINDAWSDNWGYVEMTKAEIDDMAGLLKALLKPGDVSIAEYRGKPEAFAATFPNLNEAISDMSGKLLPFGWAKLLWRMKVKRPKTRRLALMGVRKAHHNSMLGAALAFAVIGAQREFHKKDGAVEGELSWILERNIRVRRVLDVMDARPYKRYRIYEKIL